MFWIFVGWGPHKHIDRCNIHCSPTYRHHCAYFPLRPSLWVSLFCNLSLSLMNIPLRDRASQNHLATRINLCVANALPSWCPLKSTNPDKGVLAQDEYLIGSQS